MKFGRLLAGVAAGVWAVLGIAGPAAASPPLSVYGQLPGFEMASISPSGDHIAIVGTVDGVRRLLVLDSAQKLVTASNVGTIKIDGLEWAGDQAVLMAYRQTVDLGMDFTTAKAELGSVLVIPLDNTKPWVVFGANHEVTGGVEGTYGVIQRDGHWYGYFGGVTLKRTSPADQGSLPPGALEPDLYEVDLQTHKSRPLAKRSDTEDEDRRWLVDANGAVGAWLDLQHTSGNWTLYNAKRTTLASGKALLGGIELMGFTPDGASVIYATRDDKSAARQWFSVPLAGGQPQPYLEKEKISESFWDRGHRMAGYLDDSVDRTPHFFDPHREKIMKAAQRAFPGERVDLQDRNDAFDKLLVTTQGPGDPITWWTIDLHTGHADPVGTSYPIADADVGPMRMVPYVAADGMKMEGVLTLPPPSVMKGREAKALPAVILPHGGPLGYHDIAGFDWLAQSFASRGYAVFQPNYRGSSGYGDDFEHAGLGEWGGKMLSDISDGLGELVRQGIVDPKRVCIVGASYGGYAALAGVSLQQGLYRCAVAVAGVSDVAEMVDFDEDAQNGDRMLHRAFKDELGAGRDLKAISPIHFVNKISVPVLLVHGKNDTVVQYAQSKAMADALRGAGKTYQFVTLPGEDHWLSKSETRLAMLQASVDFVGKYNPVEGK